MADNDDNTNVVNEGWRPPLSPEDRRILEDLIAKEKKRRVVREWVSVVAKRAREWALVYAAVTAAIVAGREQIITFLHWMGFGGKP